MPVSPFKRAQEEGLDQPEGSSTSRRKRKSKPTSKARAKKQKTKDRYAHAREDAQLEGLIPTTPEEALQPERVPPSAQGSQPLSELVATAIRKGWATRDEVKPELVEEMVKIVLDPNMSVKAKIAAFNALRMADQSQWERDNPETAGKSKGGATSISIQTNIAAVTLLNKLLDDPTRSIEDGPTPDLAGALGYSGLNGEVEACAAPDGDKQGVGEGVADT